MLMSKKERKAVEGSTPLVRLVNLLIERGLLEQSDVEEVF